MITDQKNYVHAKMKSIKDKKEVYASLIKEHNDSLQQLIKETGNENTANIIKNNLEKAKQNEKEIQQKLANFLKDKNNIKIYNTFLKAILEDFSNVQLNKEIPLLTDNLEINPQAINSAQVNMRPLKPTESYHRLSTIDNRLTEAEKGLESLPKDDNYEELLKQYNYVKYVYNEYLKNKKSKIIRKGEEGSEDEKTFLQLEQAINELYKNIHKAGLLNTLQSRLRELVIAYMIETADKEAENNMDEFILKAINDTSVANAKVEFSFDPMRSTGVLYRNYAKDFTKKRMTKKVGNNNFYIDFGVEQVKNKIDGYIKISDNETAAISVKSYNMSYSKSSKVSLATSLNLLSLILGMYSIEKSYAFLNTIAPTGENKNRQNALNILKMQAVYAAISGHLGGRKLLSEQNGQNGNKAEYLVIEDKQSPKVWVYAVSQLIENSDNYISISPKAFELDKYKTYFKNTFIKSKSGKKNNALAAMQRNTILLIKLRQTKLHIGVRKDKLNGDFQLISKNGTAIKS